jgi:DNA-binding NtrC family response regulator
MPKVLVVDDEQGYCDFLQLHLGLAGYEVEIATAGREAIDRGVSYRPDILVTDWLLRSHIHGLHIVEALRIVLPALYTVLITEFHSQDLQAEADRRHINAFIEKPFALDAMTRTMRMILQSPPHPHTWPQVALLEVDTVDKVLYTNPYAMDLFARTLIQPDVACLQDILEPAACAYLSTAVAPWSPIIPRTTPASIWHACVRTLPPTSHRLLALVPDEVPYLIHDPTVAMLLDIPTLLPHRWPYGGPALVIDDDQQYRHLVLKQIEYAGGICHVAATPEEGQRLFLRDPTISMVILADNTYISSIPQFQALVTTLCALRPTVPIVGTSALNRRQAFRAIGVTRFLLKNWRIEGLLAVLA